MNRRQKKKQYKKIHGYNPPKGQEQSFEQICKSMNITPEQAEQAIQAWHTFTDAVLRAAADIAEVMGKAFMNVASGLRESEGNNEHDSNYYYSNNLHHTGGTERKEW